MLNNSLNDIVNITRKISSKLNIKLSITHDASEFSTYFNAVAEKVYLNIAHPRELTSLDALAEEIKALGEGETPAEMGEAYATEQHLRFSMKKK